MSTSVETATDIRTFTVDVPQEQLDELRRRIRLTRWPSKELVADRSQGVQLATMQELARYWTTDYDWRKAEAKLNALPQFTTQIDGVDIHFIHVSSPHENALPLIMTHGWPGSVIELLETVGPLTDPTAHGGQAEDAFHLVLPSLPGYGFSGEPAELGWDVGRIARAWAELMRRLGYTRYVAQGGDVGAARHRHDGTAGTQGAGRHPHEPARGGACRRRPAAQRIRRGTRRAGPLDTFRASGFGYFLEMATRPQTIGYSLLDSPVGLAAWMLDHDTDSYEKISRAFVDGEPAGNLTRDTILDNVTLYWLTGTGASAARCVLGETDGRWPLAASGQAPPEVSLPVGFTTFPGEILRPRAAGPRPSTRPSATSTKSTRAATSRRGRSRSSSRPSCGPRSGHFELTPLSRPPSGGGPIQHRPPISSSSRISRTSEGRVRLRRASSRALQAVADWIKTFVVRPHEDLGRAGTVCPFVPGSLEARHFGSRRSRSPTGTAGNHGAHERLQEAAAGHSTY